MKYKRSIFVFIMIIACAAFMFADFVISFGPAYTNYFVKAEKKITLAGIHGDIIASINNVKEENNAAGAALDLRAGLFYVMAQIAFPGKSHKELWNNVSGASDFARSNSFIFDSQLGAGFTFFKKSRFNLFVGGGLGLNAMHSIENGKVHGLALTYEKLDVMFGLGANVLASFYFTDMIGIYGGIADTFYFAPLKVEKKFKIAGIPYTISNTNNDSIKDVLANSVNLKLGLSIRL